MDLFLPEYLKLARKSARRVLWTPRGAARRIASDLLQMAVVFLFGLWLVRRAADGRASLGMVVTAIYVTTLTERLWKSF